MGAGCGASALAREPEGGGGEEPRAPAKRAALRRQEEEDAERPAEREDAVQAAEGGEHDGERVQRGRSCSPLTRAADPVSRLVASSRQPGSGDGGPSSSSTAPLGRRKRKRGDGRPAARSGGVSRCASASAVFSRGDSDWPR